MNKELTERALSLVTLDDVKSYQQYGAVCLRNILSKNEIEILKQGIELNLQNLSSRAKIASYPEDPGLFIEDFCNWENNIKYKEFIFKTPLAHIASLLMKSKTCRLYHDHTLVKEPLTKQQTPWHQDAPYYNVTGMQNCSLWIPVDHVSRSSTLEFVAGSHLGEWLMPRSFMKNEAKWFPEGSLSEIPDIGANPELFPIIGWEMSPGDIVCFHMLTLHAANGVAQNRRRRIFSVRFLGDDMIYSPRAWKTSPDFSELEKLLIPGLPLDIPQFPLLVNTEIV